MKIGIGVEQPKLVLYIQNRPPLEYFTDLNSYRSANKNEICDIIDQCGNHWRKIFSIFAKLAFATTHHECNSWQEYRDNILLTQNGHEAIIFQNKLQVFPCEAHHLICGKTFFDEFNFDENEFHNLDENEKVKHREKILQTPYFDYRQFNNALVEKVVNHIEVMTQNCITDS